VNDPFADPPVHDMYTHGNGRVCILLEDGTWFVPLDIGGEGYQCEMEHGPRTPDPMQTPVLDVYAEDQEAEGKRYAKAVERWHAWAKSSARDERAAGWDRAHTTMCSDVPCRKHRNPYIRTRGTT